MWDPRPGIELVPSLKVQCNHWTTESMCSCVCRWPHTKTKSKNLKSSGPLPGTVLKRRELSATYSAAQPHGSLACWFALSCFLVSAPLGPWSLLRSTCLSHSSLLQSIFLASLNRVSKPAYPSLEAMSSHSAAAGIEGGVLCLLNTLSKWNCCCFFAQLCLFDSCNLMDCSSHIH